MNNLQTVIKVFEERFSTNPLLIRSPGRINLIGEHTDYNMGFVLPASIDKAIYMAIGENKKNKIRLHSVDMQPQGYEVELSENYHKTGIEWADYIIGVVEELQKAGYKIGGFDCVFGGDVPIGAGLSSSAALEGGVAFGLSELFGLSLSRLEITKISMQAENEFVGVQCGIMDQFASIHGEEGKVIKLDCRSLAYYYYPFGWDNIRILLCDTNVRRTLAGSEYNIRREQCETGVEVIGKTHPEVESMRDVTLAMLENHEDEIDDIVYKRCLFVINENQRVTSACDALVNRNLEAFGKLMYASHYGLKHNYEVSCKELDVLVEATESLEGILGARMMGGGFGGCTINLVNLERLDESIESIRDYYKKHIGDEPTFHVVSISKGTHRVEKNEVNWPVNSSNYNR